MNRRHVPVLSTAGFLLAALCCAPSPPPVFDMLFETADGSPVEITVNGKKLGTTPLTWEYEPHLVPSVAAARFWLPSDATMAARCQRLGSGNYEVITYLDEVATGEFRLIIRRAVGRKKRHGIFTLAVTDGAGRPLSLLRARCNEISGHVTTRLTFRR
ncbi:MAG: hypothetical protein ACYTAF_05415 [Planctomycetota bacterium]|jgi:hypothetical protein